MLGSLCCDAAVLMIRPTLCFVNKALARKEQALDSIWPRGVWASLVGLRARCSPTNLDIWMRLEADRIAMNRNSASLGVRLTADPSETPT